MTKPDTQYADNGAYNSVVSHINNNMDKIIDEMSLQYEFLIGILTGFTGIGTVMKDLKEEEEEEKKRTQLSFGNIYEKCI